MEAIVLCGEGSSLLAGWPQVNRQPKGLTKLCGRSLVEYALEEIFNTSEVSNAKICVLDEHHGAYKEWHTFYETRYPKRTIEIVKQPSDIPYGNTAVLAAELADSKKPLTLIVSCDVIGDLNLQSIIDLHKQNDDIVLSTYVSDSDPFKESRRVNWGKSSPVKASLWISSKQLNDDPKHADFEKVEAYKLEREIIDDENGTFDITFGRMPTSSTLRRDVSDLGVYMFDTTLLKRLCSQEVQSFWDDDIDFSSPQTLNELINCLVTIQFSHLLPILKKDHDWKRSVKELLENKMVPNLEKPSEVVAKIVKQVEGGKRIFRIGTIDHFLTVQGILCNPVSTVLERVIPIRQHPLYRADPRPKALKDSYFPNNDPEIPSTDVKELTSMFQGKSLAQRSSFSGRVKVGNQTKIIECIVGKGVVFGKACKLERCVIADGVTIPDKVVLKGCVVGPETVLEAGDDYEDLAEGDELTFTD